MSDLTITQAGVTEAKKSGGEFLSADKKLNQMKIDLIDVQYLNFYYLFFLLFV